MPEQLHQLLGQLRPQGMAQADALPPAKVVQLGIFINGSWGHPAYKLPPEANLMAVAHSWRHWRGSGTRPSFTPSSAVKKPHPNFVVGGVTSPIDLNSDSAINAKRLAQVQDLMDRMRSFVDQTYLPDTLAIAGFYKDWAQRNEDPAQSGRSFSVTPLIPLWRVSVWPSSRAPP
jgi:Ni,Fe-hydrogenase I large subunit